MSLYYKTVRGFTLLELLLVLMCMAAIISWSIHHYQQIQRRQQTLLIESDIKSWQRTLDSYFHVTGCDAAGVFSNSAGSLTPNCNILQQYGDIVCSRLPLVTEYAAQIIKTDQNTAGNPAKPIYELEIRATFMGSLTAGQMTWYQQQLSAKGAVGNVLAWDSLPANSDVQSGDKSWVLNGAGAFFRASENEQGTSATPDDSGSFCAQ
jgi:prepilin-type N-terminal cleavage/methylation domain-containing protein